MTFPVFFEYTEANDGSASGLFDTAGDLARFWEKNADITGLVISSSFIENRASIDSIKEDHRHKLILSSSYRSSEEDKFDEWISVLRLNGLRRVLVNTSSALPEHPRSKKDRPLLYAEGYMDSCRLIRSLQMKAPELYIGATMNPFKYNPSDIYLHYYTAMRKLNAGAQFLVTQAGWDMKKYQECQWYFQSRKMNYPVIARLFFLRIRDVPRILNGRFPGLTLSREFASLLQKEATISENQAFAAQTRRIALQVVGCHFLGYSGVQIANVSAIREMKAILEWIRISFEELATYQDWLDTWNGFHKGIKMTPSGSTDYLYDNLLDPKLARHDPKKCIQQSLTIPGPNVKHKCMHTFVRLLGSEKWKLRNTFYCSTSACPKGLEEGVCDYSLADGICEFGHRSCIYHRILSIAKWQNQLERLEGFDED